MGLTFRVVSKLFRPALPKIPVSSIGVTFETGGSVNTFLKGENRSNRCSSNALKASAALTGDDRSSSVQDGPAVQTILILLLLLGCTVYSNSLLVA
ncbi:hypothetical protein Tco_0126296, partial [Tanacetum coccineum]